MTKKQRANQIIEELEKEYDSGKSFVLNMTLFL